MSALFVLKVLVLFKCLSIISLDDVFNDFRFAIARLKYLNDLLPLVPAPVIVEVNVTEEQLIPEDIIEQSRGRFSS